MKFLPTLNCWKRERVFFQHRALGESTIVPVEDHTSKNIWASQIDPDELLKKDKMIENSVYRRRDMGTKKLEKGEDDPNMFYETLKD